jgi:hypothetical protein
MSGTRLAAALLAAALLPARAAADPPAPERRGFTLELGTGVGHARAIPGGYDDDTGRGVDGPALGTLALGIGAYVAPRWAILFRSAGLLFRHDRGDGPRWYLNQQLGLALQHWVRPDLGFGGGPAIVLVATSPIETRSNRAIGGSLRATWAPWRWPASALAISWELQGGVFLNYEVTISSLLLVQWQLF